MNRFIRSGIFALFLFTSIAVFAQPSEVITSERPQNAIAVGALGDFSLFTLHYERLFSYRPNFFIVGKMGIGFTEEFELCLYGSCDSPKTNFFTIPHHLSANWGSGRHYFELGLGGTFINGPTDYPYIVYPIIGYRIHPLRNKAFNFRAWINIPFGGFGKDYEYLVSPIGISLGSAFGQ